MGKVESALRKKDWMVAGAAAGIAATAARVAVELILYATRAFPDIPYYEYVTMLILPKEDMPRSVSLIAFVFSIMASSVLFGTVQAYIYVRTGGDYRFRKAAGYGLILFVIHVSLIPKLWEPRVLAEQAEPWVVPWELAMHVGWGILTAYLYARLMREPRNTSE